MVTVIVLNKDRTPAIGAVVIINQESRIDRKVADAEGCVQFNTLTGPVTIYVDGRRVYYGEVTERQIIIRPLTPHF